MNEPGSIRRPETDEILQKEADGPKEKLNHRHRKRGRRWLVPGHFKETHFAARTWAARQGCLTQLPKCVSARLLEDSEGEKMREIPEKEIVWNFRYISPSETYTLLLYTLSKTYPALRPRAVKMASLPPGVEWAAQGTWHVLKKQRSRQLIIGQCD